MVRRITSLNKLLEKEPLDQYFSPTTTPKKKESQSKKYFKTEDIKTENIPSFKN